MRLSWNLSSKLDRRESFKESTIMRQACCFTVDENFILPAIVSAISVKQFLKSQPIDVIILLAKCNSELIKYSEAICLENDIILKTFDRALLEGLGLVFGRFIISKTIAEFYDKIIYLDSDIQAEGSLTPLFQVDLSNDQVAQVIDPMSLLFKAAPRFAKSNLSALRRQGFTERNLSRYYNGGLILASGSGWITLSEKCFTLAKTSKTDFRFYDQDIINLVMNGNQIPLSFNWNYPVFFDNCGLDVIKAPNIKHFMSNPRPWDGPFLPWGHKGYKIYADFAEKYPKLATSLTPFSGRKKLKYYLQQLVKRQIDGFIWDRREIRSAILDYELSAVK